MHADELLSTDTIQEQEPPKSKVKKTELLKKMTSTDLKLGKLVLGDIKCSLYSGKQGSILMTRKEIGRVLGYPEHRKTG